MKSLAWLVVVILGVLTRVEGPGLLRRHHADLRAERVCDSEVSFVREGCFDALTAAFEARTGKPARPEPLPFKPSKAAVAEAGRYLDRVCREQPIDRPACAAAIDVYWRLVEAAQ